MKGSKVDMKRTKITNENYKLEYDGYSIDVTLNDKTKFMLNIKEEQRDFVKNIFPEIGEMFKNKSFSNENSIENLINVSHSVAEPISGYIDSVNFIKIGTSDIEIERIHNMIKILFQILIMVLLKHLKVMKKWRTDTRLMKIRKMEQLIYLYLKWKNIKYLNL